MKRAHFLTLLGSSLAAGGCRPTPLPETLKWDLFSSILLPKWQEADLAESGGIKTEPHGMLIKAGRPMSGIVFKDWESEGLPVLNYQIDYDAMRVSGGDFFGTVTFPVERIDQCVSFILGGWGGYQVGISSVDGQDASQNMTGSSQPFENGMWYHVRIEVTDGLVQVWMNNRPLVRLDTAGRQLHLRAGDIDKCAPFGFASYGTEARIKDCVITRIK